MFSATPRTMPFVHYDDMSVWGRLLPYQVMKLLEIHKDVSKFIIIWEIPLPGD